MFNRDPEARAEKKLYRMGKNGAYAIGGAIGCWFLKFLYPHPEGSERITLILGPLGWLLLAYGITILGIIVVKKELALMINLLFIGGIIPGGLIYIFITYWPH
jgi:hypothetical protein